MRWMGGFRLTHPSNLKGDQIMSNPLDEFKNETAKSAFGMTKAEAHAAGICLNCKKQIKEDMFYSSMGRKEYSISGLCEYCFDLICDPEPCQICHKPESFHTRKPKLGECEEFRPAPSDYIGD